MSEISREEAIKELDVMGGNCSTDYDYKVCHQAIADMEKLQRIEEILKKGHKKCIKCDVNCDYFTVASEEYCKKLIEYDEIKRIVRGEVNE